jgi:hypothetical protein
MADLRTYPYFSQAQTNTIFTTEIPLYTGIQQMLAAEWRASAPPETFALSQARTIHSPPGA